MKAFNKIRKRQLEGGQFQRYLHSVGEIVPVICEVQRATTVALIKELGAAIRP